MIKYLTNVSGCVICYTSQSASYNCMSIIPATLFTKRPTGNATKSFHEAKQYRHKRIHWGQLHYHIIHWGQSRQTYFHSTPFCYSLQSQAWLVRFSAAFQTHKRRDPHAQTYKLLPHFTGYHISRPILTMQLIIILGKPVETQTKKPTHKPSHGTVHIYTQTHTVTLQ